MTAHTIRAIEEVSEVEVVSTEPDFYALRRDWNDLLQDSPADCIFLTWEWLSTWWKHLGAGYSLSIHTVRNCGRLTAIAPFVLKAAQPFDGRLLPALEFLGNGFVGSDYLDIIVRRGHEETALCALAVHVASSNAALRLSNVLVPESNASRLVEALDDDGWRSDRIQINVCPWILLEGLTWDSYLSGLGSETRYNFNRKWKKLNRDFSVEFEPATDETLDESVRILIAQHNARWSERGGSDAFHTSGLVDFHREFTRVALGCGWLRLFVLSLNGDPGASLYGLRYGKRFYFYQSGLNRAFERNSVGFLTMGLAIQQAISEGAVEYDLLHGDEAYKYHWASVNRPIHRIESYPPGLSGTAARACLQLGRRSRSLARRVLSSTPQ